MLNIKHTAMTKILWSGIGVTQGSGKLGNEIYSRNQGGYYKKAYASPIVNPNANGLAVRDIYALLSDAWADLPTANQLEWISAARDIVGGKKLHRSKCLSGWNYFYQVNFNLVVIDQAVIYEPPKKAGHQEILAATYLGIPSPTSILLQWTFSNTGNATDTSHYLMVCMSACWSLGRHSYNIPINFIKYFAPTVNPSTTNLISAYETIWPTPTVNKRIFVKAFLINKLDGSRSVPFFSNIVIQ